MDWVIVTNELSRLYGKQVACDRVNLRVGRGRVFGLLGPNGAGKTTTIKMLITLLKPSFGSAIVAGFDVVRHPANVRKNIGYVPQLLSADGTLTGRENLMLSARLYGVPRPERSRRISEALGFMDLGDVANKLVKTYSGGMIRKLEIALAMLHRPTVLFLDEPTPGLDPVARKLVWDRLKELQRTYEMTILMTTHDMDEAEYLCDELAIMHRGQIAASGKPSELKSAIGEHATLADVFVHFSGGSISEGGTYRDAGEKRRTAERLG